MKFKEHEGTLLISAQNIPLTQVSDSDLRLALKLLPDTFSDSDLLELIQSYNRQRSFKRWRRDLDLKHKALPIFEKENLASVVEHWNRLINEHADFSFAKELGEPIPGTPLHNFDIVSIYSHFADKDKENGEIAYRLIDVKLYFGFLKYIAAHQYQGPFKIIGNNELEKLTPEALNWLAGISNTILTLSALIEKTLDFLELALTGSCKDHRKDKWLKKIVTIKEHFNISDEEKNLLINFKENYRTSEVHKLSRVRSMTAKDKWDHCQKEVEAISDILDRMFVHFTAPSFKSS